MNEALEITKKGPKPRPLSPHLQIYSFINLLDIDIRTTRF